MNAIILDEQEDLINRERALDVTRSFIVQAPAGSGKTSLLTQRFLSLLTTVKKDPEECLALTFTRKAAHEMRDRILNALEQAKNKVTPENPYEAKTFELARKVLERDEMLAWDLLDNPHRLKIQTLDALSASITSAMPILSGFGGVEMVTEKPGELYSKAAQNCLKLLESNAPFVPHLCHLLEHLDNHLLVAERLLSEMLLNREQWLPHVGRSQNLEDARNVLESGLEKVVLETLEIVVAEFESINNKEDTLHELLELMQFGVSNLASREITSTDTNAESGSSVIEKCLEWTTLPGAQLKDLPAWQAISELILTNSCTIRKTVTQHQGFPSAQSAHNKEEKAIFQSMKVRVIELLEKMENEPNFIDALIDLKRCPPLKYSDAEWKILDSLVNLLPYLVAELMVVFQEEGKVDFAEVQMAASRALGEKETPTDLALGLDYKIRHILVDEFQDTSIPQLRLLEQLVVGWLPNDGRTLFLVGDPMQSIYRFRQAEVSLFLKAKHQGLGGIPVTSLVLSGNFRSDPELVTWTNQLFKNRFPEEDDFTCGAIRFSPSVAKRPQSGEAKVVVHTLSKKENHEVESKIKDEIVNVKDEVGNADKNLKENLEENDFEKETQKIIEYIHEARNEDPEGSMALLVRSRSRLKNILPLLQQAGINYQAIELEALHERPIVGDLLALTRALIHLGDRIAWLALLRGPWCGLNLSDLLWIAKWNPDAPIWWALTHLSEIPELSPDTRKYLDEWVQVMEPLLLLRERMEFSDWVFHAWQQLLTFKGFPCDLPFNEPSDAQSFFNILRQEEKNRDFFRIGELKSAFQSLYAKPKAQEEVSLQVLTVHKAKGLEFDTVILTGVGRRLRSDTEKLLLWEERPGKKNEPYLIMAPIKSKEENENPIYAYLKYQNSKRSRFEEDRLLYVAMTRAKKRLYCLSHDEELF